MRAQFGKLTSMANPMSNITVITDDGVAPCMLDVLRDAKEMLKYLDCMAKEIIPHLGT